MSMLKKAGKMFRAQTSRTIGQLPLPMLGRLASAELIQ